MTTNHQATTARGRRITAAAVLLTAGAIAAGGLGAAPANADVTHWVTIAYSPATGAFGVAPGYTDLESAGRASMQYCRNAGGGDDCRIVVVGQNQWAALATNFKGDWSVGTGPFENKAELNAELKIPAGRLKIAASPNGDIVPS
jgi:Domain of unknown function (DUF4189)